MGVCRSMGTGANVASSLATARAQAIAKQQVLDIGELQFLMLLLVLQPRPNQRSNLFTGIGRQKAGPDQNHPNPRTPDNRRAQIKIRLLLYK